MIYIPFGSKIESVKDSLGNDLEVFDNTVESKNKVYDFISLESKSFKNEFGTGHA